MKLFHWHIHLTRNDGEERNLAVGDRIRTIRGYGTVTGGSFYVKLDKPYRGENGYMNSGFTHNLDKLRQRKIDA